MNVAVNDALNVWNGFVFSLILIQSPDKKVPPLSLRTFQGQFNVNIPADLAAMVLSTLPTYVPCILGPRPPLARLTAGFSK